jgi:TolB-like protein/Tfp pilus assembly protein PilF
MSGDKEQEYFSDGLTEEILNSLARLSELQVTARTSSFSFKGKEVTIATIGHELNVAAVLEGSVRRSGHTVRITTQLVDAVTGFHLWSATYDRDLRDVLKLQTEIATAVATALKVSLLANVAAKSELGGTSNPAAFDAYLRGRRASGAKREELLSSISAYTEATRLDPGYALAFVARSGDLNFYAANWATGAEVQEGLRKAEADARRALALAPNLADAHLALANYYVSTLELERADEEYSHAGALEPDNALFLQSYGLFATQIGRTEVGLAAMRRAIRLDPVSAGPHEGYGYVLYLARRYEEAITAYDRGLSVQAEHRANDSPRGLAYYALGKLDAALSSCERDDDDVDTIVCSAVTYNKLGRRADAKLTLAKFMKLRADADAYAYAEIYAQWGETSGALEWLEKAARLRDTGLILLRTDPLMDPLRKEPRFQAIERELKFPN